MMSAMDSMLAGMFSGFYNVLKTLSKAGFSDRIFMSAGFSLQMLLYKLMTVIVIDFSLIPLSFSSDTKLFIVLNMFDSATALAI